MGSCAKLMHFKCGHPGCNELAHYEYHSRDEATRLQKSYYPDKWRCTRHSRPNEVLGEANRVLTSEMRVFEEPHGKYWGTDKAWTGFISGPGFKAFAEDFPTGTVIRVTAEIVRPSPDGEAHG